MTKRKFEIGDRVVPEAPTVKVFARRDSFERMFLEEIEKATERTEYRPYRRRITGFQLFSERQRREEREVHGVNLPLFFEHRWEDFLQFVAEEFDPDLASFEVSGYENGRYALSYNDREIARVRPTKIKKDENNIFNLWE